MNTIIQTITPNLEKSKEFYTKLGFSELSTSKPSQFSGGNFIIELNEERTARLGIKLFANDWNEVIKQLPSNTNILKIDGGHLLSDPSGVWIYLMDGEKTNTNIISDTNTSHLGIFAGISIESISMSKSIIFWETLGFTRTMGDIDQGWLCLQNKDKMTISIMKAFVCPHLFFNPSLSFFNGSKNLEIIKKVNELKIPITEEITHFSKEGIVDNIIISDPGGLGFFIFSD